MHLLLGSCDIFYEHSEKASMQVKPRWDFYLGRVGVARVGLAQLCRD